MVSSQNPAKVDFEPNANGYSARNAWGLAKAARLAYQMPDTIAQTLKTWGNFPNFRFFSGRETQAYLMGNDDLAVLAFRGTQSDNLRDWMTDAKILLVPGCSGKVHAGFLEGVNWIWTDLLRELPRFRQNNQRLFVTGHSLGAALATVATAKLQEAKQPVDGLYTFGSPRVGDKKFADAFDQVFGQRAFRLVNNNDVVTRVAPRAMNYSHVSRCLYFDAKSKLQDDIVFWEKFLEGMRGNMDDFLKPGLDNFKDHDMGIYEKNVSVNLNFKLTTNKPRWVQKLL
jgi:triacylglycerol lipase